MTPQNTSYWKKRPMLDTHQDWKTAKKFWIDGYKDSEGHPHREVIMKILDRLQPLSSLLELGCSVGPNLKLISKRFPRMKLFGIDPNAPSVAQASSYIPTAKITVGDMRKLGTDFPLKSVDVVLADASLMYITPREIRKVMDSIALVAKKAVIIVERCSDSKTGEICGGVWGRDYETLLKERGFRVSKEKVTQETWPFSPNWQKFGYFIVGVK